VDLRQSIREGLVGLSQVGEVLVKADGMPPFVVSIDGLEVEPVSAYLTELILSDTSPLTVESYAYDLLRWWRLLALVDVAWDRASRAEVELMVGWMRSAANPQRRRADLRVAQPGSVNLKTGKPALRAGYAPSTINHQLSVLAAFYEFHLLFGRGPLVNPVPIAAERRHAWEHRSPLEPTPVFGRAPLRQKVPKRAPRSIPDTLWDELFATMGNDRDRALLAFYVSSGARATELLELIGKHVDWGRQRIWVVSKGSREVSMVPGSPEAFGYLARYFDAFGTPGPQERVWRTMRGASRPLTYWAMRRVIQRANERLGTNWSLHDLRHTAATRMASDPELTLPEVQTIMRHRHLATTEAYLQPRIEELHDKLQEHFRRPRPEQSYPADYRQEDIETVFGD
jgi:integrase